ncbi:MAG: hypothetical protein M1833_005011 [Piccolia ochrophora]|nr:MAG: hypothetical protein M1833_005011 [Piccolia ochrophora]
MSAANSPEGPASARQSESPVPTTEVNDGEADSNVTEDEWEAMQTVLDAVYQYRDDEGRDPFKVFHRKVNKRLTPDYYDVIKEPMALSTVKANINSKTYKEFSDFVRDFALISHNAQTYNKPEAPAYKDALVLKSVVEGELKKLVDQKTISGEAAALPDLGEIPPHEEGEDEDEEEEDDEDDEGDDSDEEGVRRRRRRGPRSTAANTKRDGGDASKGTEADLRKKRGRPPRVDTPMEARIKAIIKGLRKLRGSDGSQKITKFEKLPDKAQMPEYFSEIKNPMALDTIKACKSSSYRRPKKSKRKKYQSVDHFMKDVDTMFENAKLYNRDDSEIYKDAVELQEEGKALAEQEKKKPDTEYEAEDGKQPLPGILRNGELWKIGDWVHIQNPNDLTKPIVAQIYRTWRDSDGQEWVNACWYYRPEQTVHRFEKHFFEGEVVKTGQYRDHHIEEVVDRCFVMFVTRFSKGRPRGFPENKEVYVCESRYNEEKHKLNKIKTWASCLPDEVREKDYEMDLFDTPKKMKKVPSPIKHLLRDDAEETDDLPKPTWGAENAPPIVGAVHKRPREANESPPPEPTPSPPPEPPRPAPGRRISTNQNQRTVDGDGDVPMGGTGSAPQAQMSSSTPKPPPQTPAPFNSHFSPQPNPQQSGSPARQLRQIYSPQAHSSSAQSTPQATMTSQTPAPFQRQDYSTPQQPGYGYNNSTSVRPAGQANAYNPPRPSGVFHLPDHVNASIPQDIREQFHRDAHGHVLFFDTPPTEAPTQETRDTLSHTDRYRAAKVRRFKELSSQKKREAEARAMEANVRQQLRAHEAEDLHREVDRVTGRAWKLYGDQQTEDLVDMWAGMYGAEWREGAKAELARLERVQRESAATTVRVAANRRKRVGEDLVEIRNGPVFLDDYDPRY